MLPDLPADSLGARFAQRLVVRDGPPLPPAAASQEPAAIEARIRDWLRLAHRVRDSRSQGRLAPMLRALMEAPQCPTTYLAQVAGQHQQNAAARNVEHLRRLGLISSHYEGRTRYHRLTRPTEDALLLVVAGPGGLSAHTG